jgi:hypothetical protein
MDQQRPPDQPGSEPPGSPQAAGQSTPPPTGWGQEPASPQQPATPPPATPPPATGWGQQPPPGSQPPMTWAPEPPASARPFVRTGEVTAAAIILLVLGVLGILVGVLFLLFGGLVGSNAALIQDQPGFEGTIPMTGAIAGAIGIFGAIFIVYSLAYIAAGWGGLRGREWARVLGIVIAIIGVLFWLLGLTSPDNSGLVFALIVLAAHAWVLFAYGVRWRRA